MARRKIAKKPKPAAKPAKQYAAFGDVHEEAVQMLGEKYPTTELADSGDEFVILLGVDISKKMSRDEAVWCTIICNWTQTRKSRFIGGQP